MLKRICNVVANPVAAAMLSVNKYVQKIVNSQAVSRYVTILTRVRFLVSITCFVLAKCSCKQPRLNPQ